MNISTTGTRPDSGVHVYKLLGNRMIPREREGKNWSKRRLISSRPNCSSWTGTHIPCARERNNKKRGGERGEKIDGWLKNKLGLSGAATQERGQHKRRRLITWKKVKLERLKDTEALTGRTRRVT